VIKVFDNFVANPEIVRQSALRAGFGTWHPNKGDTGLDFYEGVSFWGDHATLFRALYEQLGRQIIPSSMFFRVTNPQMERSLVHSDREYGEYTAIVYLSPNTIESSGTGFYKHRETGWIDMPSLEELMRDRAFFERFRQQTLDASDADWEMCGFVEAKYNRCLVFDAPKFHCRLPKESYGIDESDSRMVWVAHFNIGNQACAAN
jgi:hypothetical protein